MRTSTAAAFAIAALTTFGLAGCGDDSSDSGAPSSTARETIEVNGSSLGDVLTDGDGNTLYLFEQDTAGQSNCEGQCLAEWPALAGTPAAGDGTDASLIGTIKRSDGSTQATYNGHPLYYFADDSSPGDVTGQDNDGFYVLDSSGTAVEGSDEGSDGQSGEPSESQAPESSDPGGSYGY